MVSYRQHKIGLEQLVDAPVVYSGSTCKSLYWTIWMGFLPLGNGRPPVGFADAGKGTVHSSSGGSHSLNRLLQMRPMPSLPMDMVRTVLRSIGPSRFTAPAQISSIWSPACSFGWSAPSKGRDINMSKAGHYAQRDRTRGRVRLRRRVQFRHRGERAS